jgi:hypothetical protein
MSNLKGVQLSSQGSRTTFGAKHLVAGLFTGNGMAAIIFKIIFRKKYIYENINVPLSNRWVLPLLCPDNSVKGGPEAEAPLPHHVVQQPPFPRFLHRQRRQAFLSF